jgi:hypothetical protein
VQASWLLSRPAVLVAVRLQLLLLVLPLAAQLQRRRSRKKRKRVCFLSSEQSYAIQISS